MDERERFTTLPFVALTIDVAVSMVASIVGWHPIEALVARHARALHVALVVLFGAVSMMPLVLLVDELGDRRPSRIEEALVPPVLVLFCMLGWLVPYGLGAVIDPRSPASLAVAPLVVFGAALFAGVGFGWLFASKAGFAAFTARAFRTRVVRSLIAGIAAAWFFVCEATFFLALAGASKHRWMVLPLCVLAYLPIRWVLQVLTGGGRSERWSLWLAFAYLFGRLALT